MILRAGLTAAVLALMGYGRLPVPCLAAGSVLLGLLLAWGGKKAGHVHALELVDQTARRSPWAEQSVRAKGLLCLTGLGCCVTARSLVLVLVLWVAALGVLLLLGGVSLRRYLRLMALPGSFLLLGALALVVELGPVPAPGEVLSLPVPGGCLSVTGESQRTAALVTLRALGGVSWMYVLALTTPMARLLETLQGIGLPKVLVELMFLTYRYLFLLWELLETMSQAAQCRLGWRGLSAGVRTSGAIASVLLSRSLGQARRSLAAMEARCWQGDVALEGSGTLPLTPRQGLLTAAALAGLISISRIAWRGGWP